MNQTTELRSCNACGSNNLLVALDLGEQPLANSYLDTPEQEEPVYPLRANVCGECQHVQLSHAVDPDLMFKNYLYVSGTTQTLHDNMRWFAGFVQEFTGQYGGSVLDIGCNDGTQLTQFKELGWTTYGIDPAENIVPLAQEKGHNVVCDYFDARTVPGLAQIQPTVIVAQNVVAHNYNALQFLKNVRTVMPDNGYFFMQISQVDMIRRNEFDTCYHEHINFFNVLSLIKIADRAGLFIQDIVKQPIHGNSYIVVFHKTKGRPHRIGNLLALDRSDGMNDLRRYEYWGQNAARLMDELRTAVATAREQGFKVVGYGAAAKGMTVLNFAKLELDFIIDDNPLKQGKFAPGVRTPIVSIDELQKYENTPMVFIPLAWNFFGEIKQRIQQVRANPDRFLRYFPEVEYVA
jgi:SAM-dependent methyltransferase